MKPVRAFGDRVRFLPSIPATPAVPLHSIGYSNALVEMAQQSWQLVHTLAVEHTRLVHQIQQMGLAHELGQSAIDAMLETVANGGEVPVQCPRSLRLGA